MIVEYKDTYQVQFDPNNKRKKNNIQKIVTDFYESDKALMFVHLRDSQYIDNRSAKNSFRQAIRALKYPMIIRSTTNYLYIIRIDPDEYTISRRKKV